MGFLCKEEGKETETQGSALEKQPHGGRGEKKSEIRSVEGDEKKAWIEGELERLPARPRCKN